MPHQLIRILGINIRDTQTQLPTCLIAELKTKYRVMAVGVNGVGKSSFMRLLPLFYGSTPQQILRGTGLPSMISHTLPDASSAVAYEYCRETDDDLRCVVMHCRPNEEAPQFHIIHGGYREDFFYDENGDFVRREEFKARVEAMGLPVTKMLVLSEYRAVILNERSLTKNSEELRKLAAVYSLGPKSLRNLDQIAAAMANEKISFRDLKEIVIERVSDSKGDERNKSNNRELKKNKKDVTKWLEDRDHLAKIMAEKPNATQMRSRIEKIHTSHFKLCSHRVAVYEAIKSLKAICAELDQKKQAITENSIELEKSYKDESSQMTVEKKSAYDAWKTKNDFCNATKDKLKRFQDINVVLLEQEQLKEPSLKAELQSTTSEIDRINTTSGGLSSKAEKAKSAIKDASAKLIEDLSDQLLKSSEQIGIDIKNLIDAENDALNAIQYPDRFNEIAEEKKDLHTKIGELNGAIKNPQAAQDLRTARDEAFTDFQSRSDELSVAKDSVATSLEVKRIAKAAFDEANDKVHSIQNAQNACQSQLDELEKELAPPPDSLMSFVRNSDKGIWRELVKIINPTLIKDPNLAPSTVDELISGLGEGKLIANSVCLNTSSLEQPYWVEISDVRNAILNKKTELASITLKLNDATENSQKHKREFDLAQSKWNTAVAQESLAVSAYSTAKANHERYIRSVQQAEIGAKQAAQIEQDKLKQKLFLLESEESSITTNFSININATKNHFTEERKKVEASGAARGKSIEADKQAADKRKTLDLKRVDDDYANELAGMGIDHSRISELNARRQDIESSLLKIANFKHEVQSWKEFQSKVLPSMDTDAMECDRLNQKFSALTIRLSDLENDFSKATAQAIREINAIDTSILKANSQCTDLEHLRDNDLKDFVDYVAPKNLSVDWQPEELIRVTKTEKTILDAEAEELKKEERKLRNIMQEQSGPVNDWVVLKNKELPDRQTVLGHIYISLEARVLCDWFEPHEHGPYIDQLNKEMNGYLSVAANFVRELELFERKVDEFNAELKKALSTTESFARFKELTVNIRSGIAQMDNMKLLRTMTDISNSKNSTIRAILTQEREISTKEESSIIRQFRDILPSEGALRVKLDDQVKLECSLIENGKSVLITNDAEFAAVSSNGNTALITSMFLVGFIEMVRGKDSPVRLTWLTDEIGRFDGSNLGAFLNTLDKHKIDVISACPSIDPALARYFPRISVFENDGGIKTTERFTEDTNVAA